MSISRFLQAPPNIFLFKYAPYSFSIWYLRLLGKLYYIANRKERRLIEKNIMTVFQSRTEAREIIQKSFDGIFSHYSEKLLMAYRNLGTLKKEVGGVIEYSGLHYLDNALKKGGVVLVTGHFGAVEFMPLALHLKNLPVSMVVAFQTQRLKKSLEERAESNGIELIDGHSGNIFFNQVNALKRGRILLTECDEVDAWSTKGDRTIDAFGGKVKLDRSIEVLCRRSGATPLGAFLIRTAKGYRLTIVPIGEEAELKSKNLAEDIFKTFERFVMMSPDQWYQWKKFHKMRPEVA